MDINDVITQKMSRMSPEQKMAFIRGLSEEEVLELTSAVDISLKNKAKKEQQSGFDSILGGMQPGQTAPSDIDITSQGSQDLAKGIVQTGAAVAAGGPLGAAAKAAAAPLLTSAGATGALEAIGLGVAEGLGGSLGGEVVGNVVTGQGLGNTKDNATAAGLGIGLGGLGGGLGFGAKKVLANETVKKGIESVMSKAQGVLKGIGSSADDAATNIFNKLVKSREDALNALNKRRVKVIDEFKKTPADQAEVNRIKRAYAKVSRELGGEQRGTARINTILNKENVTKADLIKISDETDFILAGADDTLVKTINSNNVKGIVNSTVPEKYQALNNEYVKHFQRTGDSFNPNNNKLVSLIKQKADKIDVPKENIVRAITDKGSAKIIGKGVDDKLFDAKDVETVFLGGAASKAKKVPTISTTGDSAIVDEITSKPFNVNDELNSLIKNEDKLIKSGKTTLDANNRVASPEQVFSKFDDDNFSNTLKEALGSSGSTRFTNLKDSANSVNRAKVLSSEVSKLAPEASAAAQDTLILDDLTQGFGAAQDIGALNRKLGTANFLKNPANASMLNQLIQRGSTTFSQ